MKAVIDATKVKERPIIFGGHSIRAILSEAKTQTRRVIKPQPVQDGEFWIWKHPKLDAGYCHTNRDAMESLMLEVCPYGKAGDHLWMREKWFCAGEHECDGYPVRYEADAELVRAVSTTWRTPIFMPRWASRGTLEIKSIWVERVQEISEEDAIAEGLTAWSDPPRVTKTHYGELISDVWETDPRKAYWRLFDSINAKRGYPVESNPWVYALDFSLT